MTPLTHPAELLVAVFFTHQATRLQMRQWFDDPAGVEVPDSDVQGDLTAAIRGSGATRFDSNGRLVLEAKEHIKERLTFSPGTMPQLWFCSTLTSPGSVDLRKD